MQDIEVWGTSALAHHLSCIVQFVFHCVTTYQVERFRPTSLWILFILCIANVETKGMN